MKKIDWLILRSFIPPFIATFFITLFVFLMQFVWKYIDDLAGKDLEFTVVAKLLFYTSASLVPLSLPLACLLASIMTMGNLAEYQELTAFKSSGISLFRFLRSIVMAGLALSFFAFLFNNYIIPVANLKSGTLLYDIQNSKPSLSIKEGKFNNGIEGYSIKISKKDMDGKTIHDVMIYDHTSGRGNDNIIVAKQGELVTTADKRFLIITLKDGSHYQDMPPKNSESAEFVRIDFKEYKKYFDLSGFRFERTNENLFKNHYQMMNITQLNNQVDTILKQRGMYYANLNNYISRFYNFMYLPDSTLQTVKTSKPSADFYNSLPIKERRKIAERAVAIAQDVRSNIISTSRDEGYSKENEARFDIEIHHKFSYSLACLLLIIMGAALGAIIRKGGLGMPLVVAVVFFVVFHVSNMTGQKFAEGMKMPVWLGCWLPLIVLFPVALWVVNKARQDALVFLSRDSIIHKFYTIKWIPRFMKPKFIFKNYQ